MNLNSRSGGSSASKKFMLCHDSGVSVKQYLEVHHGFN